MAITLSVLLIVLVVVGIAALGVLIWALVRAVETMRSVKRLADDADRDLVPLAAKADATLDLLGAELMRVDVIVDQVQDVADTVQETRRAAATAADRAVVSVGKFGRAVRDVFRTESGQGPPQQGDPR